MYFTYIVAAISATRAAGWGIGASSPVSKTHAGFDWQYAERVATNGMHADEETTGQQIGSQRDGDCKVYTDEGW